MSIDISSLENHVPKIYDDDVEAWETKVGFQLDIEAGLRATNTGDVVAESMTPQDMHGYDRTISDAKHITSDPQDYFNCGELACLEILELELEFAEEYKRMRNNTLKVEEN